MLKKIWHWSQKKKILIFNSIYENSDLALRKILTVCGKIVTHHLEKFWLNAKENFASM